MLLPISRTMLSVAFDATRVTPKKAAYIRIIKAPIPPKYPQSIVTRKYRKYPV